MLNMPDQMSYSIDLQVVCQTGINRTTDPRVEGQNTPPPLQAHKSSQFSIQKPPQFKHNEAQSPLPRGRRHRRPLTRRRVQGRRSPRDLLEPKQLLQVLERQV